jgi:hypothetical protein
LRELGLKVSQLTLKFTKCQPQLAFMLIDLLKPSLILFILVCYFLYSIEFLLSPIDHLFLDPPRLLVGTLTLVELGRHDRLVVLEVLVETAYVRLQLPVHLVLEGDHVEFQISV